MPEQQIPRAQGSPGRTGRRPLVQRRLQARRLSRIRANLMTRRPLTGAQRAVDPLARGHLPRTRQVLVAAGAFLASALVHLAVVGLGRVDLQRTLDDRHQVAIEVRERLPPPPPPPPPPPEPEPPQPVVERPSRPPPKAAPAPPPEPPKAPPPRVVGLSLESTTESGGSGPSFAVGNTRAGETAKEAVAPEQVPSEAPPSDTPPQPNQVASRIPTAGVRYTQPRRLNPGQPPYPETLKAQGIEAEVPVMVSLDSTGKVISVKILKESAYPEFNESARRQAFEDRYEPALRDGIPIPYSFSFVYRFRLEDQ